MSISYDPMGLRDYSQVVDMSLGFSDPFVCKREAHKVLRSAEESFSILEDLNNALAENPNQALRIIEHFKKNHSSIMQMIKHRDSVGFGQNVPTLCVYGIGYFRNKKDLVFLQIIVLMGMIFGSKVFLEQVREIYMSGFATLLIVSLSMGHRGSPQLLDYWHNSKDMQKMQSRLQDVCMKVLNSVNVDTPEHNLLQEIFTLKKTIQSAPSSRLLF